MKSYVYVAILSLLAFFILLLVYNFGDIPNRHKNGFKRKYFPTACSGFREITLRDTLSGIVGSTPSTIYVAVATEGELLEIGTGVNGKIKRMKIPHFTRFYDSLKFSSLAIKVDSPRIYLFAENKPAIIKTTFDSTIFEIRILPPGPFTREVMVDTGCFILRKIEPRLTDQLFVRYDFGTGLLKKENNISQLYGDGGIITDGQLHADDETRRVYYIYYYRNWVLSFDTSLESAAKFSSIDTTSSFKMQTGLVKNGPTTAYTNITPANIINKASAVQHGLLFNLSTLKADNDQDEFFFNNSILDVIDLTNGRYQGSISLPVFNGSKISQFIISNNRLIGLYTNSIVICDLHLDIAR